MAALCNTQDTTADVARTLARCKFSPRLPGLTKLVSKFGKEGCWRKALGVYESLHILNIVPDTAITNAAISACDKGAVTNTCFFFGGGSHSTLITRSCGAKTMVVMIMMMMMMTCGVTYYTQKTITKHYHKIPFSPLNCRRSMAKVTRALPLHEQAWPGP